MSEIITEYRNENTKNIDLLSTIDIVRKINEEDKLVALAIEDELPNIAKAVDIIAKQFLKGGRLFYYGAGTSGRLGILDASECPPTFGVPADMVQGIMAGGDKAFKLAVEGAEDNFELGRQDAEILTSNDVCVAISASGNPKYLLGVLAKAEENGCKTIALTCNHNAAILEEAGHEIVGEAMDGQDGINKYKDLKPDIVTLDITMPVMDGLEALKNIKADDQSAKVIMVTAAGQQNKMIDAIKMGASEFVTKPFEPDEIIKMVSKLA